MGNQQAKDQYGRSIDWEHAERPSPPGKPYLAPDSADLPDIIKLRWEKPMYDGGAPIIGYVVEHRRTGSPHWLRASAYLTTDTELVLTGLEPGWRYQFRVTAENAIGRSDPGELSEPLTVTLQRSAASAPHFNRELEDLIALENDTVEFIVQVLATPAPKISWYKDGFELFSSRRTKIVTDNETSTLIIYNAALEDEGEIKCSATNRAGHVVTKSYLKLEALPRIRLPRQYEEGLIFEKGETIRLKVSAGGRPPPLLIWHHNGQPIMSGGRHEINDTDYGSILRITDACRQDRGEYMVLGSNHNGEDFASFLVTITDRPSSPGKPEVVMTLGKSATLKWSEPEDDGGCKIGAYIVEYFRIGWDMWLKAATSRQLNANLTDLIEGSEYKFRVKAENPYGVSEPSEESDVIFIPDPKHGIFKPERKAQAEDNEDLVPKRDGEERKRREAPPEIPETDIAKRRRLLEENARKLLDTPITVLLSTTTDNQLMKPPPRRKSRSGSPSISPIPLSSEESGASPPPVPKRRKAKLQRSPEPDTDTSPCASPTLPGPLSPVPPDEDRSVHGSSELVLILLPDDQKGKSTELNAQQKAEIEIRLSEPGVAPPMSLSAPELSCSEPLELPLLREAVSSSELLHELAMNRLYQDAAEEELLKAESRRKSLERRPSLRGAVLERRHSFKDTVEPLSRPLTAKPPLSNSPVLATKIPRLILKSSPSEEKAATIEETKKPSRLTREDRMNSVEREQLEFARVRELLRQRHEEKQQEKQRQNEARQRLATQTKTQTNVNSQISSVKSESEVFDEELEDEEEIFDEEMGEEEEEEVEDEEEEYEDEDMEVDEEEINDTILEEDEELDEEPLKTLKDSKFRPRSIIPEKPPPAVPLHGILKKGKSAPMASEEDTYHPRSMIPTRSVVRALPATVEIEEPVKPTPDISVNEEKPTHKAEVKQVNEDSKLEKNEEGDLKKNNVIENQKVSEPDEEISAKDNVIQPQVIKEEEAIIKPTEAKEATNEAKAESPSRIPIPKKEKKKSKLFKLGFGLKKDKEKEKQMKGASVAMLIKDSVTPSSTIALPKPILKNKGIVMKKEKDRKKSESPPKEDSPEKMKKQVRIAEPGSLTVPTVDPNASPMTKKRNEKIQRRQQSLEEEEEANKVLICHYSDIVKEFGGAKKPPPKLYLDLKELEAHAEPETEDVMMQVEEERNKDETEVKDEIEDEKVSRKSPSPEKTVIPNEDKIEESEELPAEPIIDDFKEDTPEKIEEPDEPEVIEPKKASPSPSLRATPSPTPSSTHSVRHEEKLKSLMDYVTDVGIFIFACWVYLFKSEIYVIPVLLLLVFRQLDDVVQQCINVKDAILNKACKLVGMNRSSDGEVEELTTASEEDKEDNE